MNKVCTKSIAAVASMTMLCACGETADSISPKTQTPVEYVKSVETRALEKFNTKETVSTDGKANVSGYVNINTELLAEEDIEDMQGLPKTLELKTDLQSVTKEDLTKADGIITLNGSKITDFATVMSSSDLYIFCPDAISGAWGKVAVSENAPDTTLPELLDSTDLISKMLNGYTDILTDDMVKLNAESELSINKIKQDCATYTVSLDNAAVNHISMNWSEIFDNEGLNDYFDSVSDFTVSDPSDLLESYGLDESTTGDVSVEKEAPLDEQFRNDIFKNMYVTTYVDKKGDIIGRDVSMLIAKKSDFGDTVPTGMISTDACTDVNYIIFNISNKQVRDGSKFAAILQTTIDAHEETYDLGTNSEDGGRGKIFENHTINFLADVNGTVSDIDRLSGTANLSINIDNKHQGNNISIAFSEVSYLAGLNGYMTGEYKFNAGQLNDMINNAKIREREEWIEQSREWYPDMTDEEIFDKVGYEIEPVDWSPYDLIVTFDKKDKTQTFDFSMLKSGVNMISVGGSYEYDDNCSEDVIPPENAEAFDSMEDYTDTIDGDAIVNRIMSVLGVDMSMYE